MPTLFLCSPYDCLPTTFQIVKDDSEYFHLKTPDAKLLSLEGTFVENLSMQADSRHTYWCFNFAVQV